MVDTLLLALVALTALVSTSFDSLLVLVAYHGADDVDRHSIRNGYLLGVTIVLLGSFVGAKAVEALPGQHVGWLGLVPLALGLHGLSRLALVRVNGAPSPSESPGLRRFRLGSTAGAPD